MLKTKTSPLSSRFLRTMVATTFIVATCFHHVWAQSGEPTQESTCQKWQGVWTGTWPFVPGERILEIQNVDQNCVATINWDKGRVKGEFKIEKDELNFLCPPNKSACWFGMKKSGQSLEATHQRQGQQAGFSIFKKVSQN